MKAEAVVALRVAAEAEDVAAEADVAGAEGAEGSLNQFPDPAFSVIDALGGVFSLTRRTPTLDGSVPLRVAQACVPHLEGNAFGYQISLNSPLTVSRRMGVTRVTAGGRKGADLDRQIQAAPITVRTRGEGYPARETGARRFCRSAGFRTLEICTGLYVRPESGLVVRVSTAGNRRNLLFEVEDGVFGPEEWTQIVLRLRFRETLPARIQLDGELATLAVFPSVHSFNEVDLKEARDMAEKHVAFFDKEYFETKREAVTGKYRRLISGITRATGQMAPETHFARAGPVELRVEIQQPFNSRGGEAGLPSLVFYNSVGFSVMFDGHTVWIEPDRDSLRQKATLVEKTLRGAFGEEFGQGHPGWLLYFTKYFTPHPPGEPHFFVKPWALMKTAPGWSMLVDGVNGAGYDVMRGVVATDVFHAAPAVFRILRIGEWVRIPEGRRLTRMMPFPRGLEAARFGWEELT